ncbi:MAG TPA: Smr/MutS family protein [Burkholderiaceae bacterium]|nr:Smr/MutS family protein [Burkholderiaceae bacterium]
MKPPSVKAHGLHALEALKRDLQRARREVAEEAARQREQAARERRERELFALTVGPVVPLHRGSAQAVAQAGPHPVPRQRERDEAAVMHEAISDEFDVESLLETDESLSFRRPGIAPDVVRKLRRGVWAIQAQLDLHGLRRDAARVRLADFLRAAGEEQLRCVRVIHGKGHGSPGREPVLKAKVKSWLAQHAQVLAYTQARAADGGAGALVVLLASSSRRVET